jgi:hypothetical protein
MSIKKFYFDMSQSMLTQHLHDNINQKKAESQSRNSEAVNRYLTNNHLTKIATKPPAPPAPSNARPPPYLSSYKTNSTAKKPTEVSKSSAKLPVKQYLGTKPENDIQSPNKAKSAQLNGILKKPISSNDEQTHLNEKLEIFRFSKPEEQTKPSNKNLCFNSKSPNESSSDDETIADYTNDPFLLSESYENYMQTESKDIAKLHEKLNKLRKKLYNNLNENEEDEDEEEEEDKSGFDEVEVEISSNFKERDNQEDSLCSISAKQAQSLSNRCAAPKINSQKFDKLPQNKSSNYSNAHKGESINFESLDVKAKDLIDRSESSLTNRLHGSVSSDGLGSSQNSTSTIMSDVAVSSKFRDKDPYKPEFFKFLENKSKLGHSSVTGDQLKPEDDILYQWRLRRKIEEAKNNVSNCSFSNQIAAKIPAPTPPQMPAQISSLTETPSSNPPLNNITKTNLSNEIISNTTNTKFSCTQTQARKLLDSCVQTSLDLTAQTHEPPNSNIISNEIFSENDESEVPTRDDNNTKTRSKISQQKRKQYANNNRRPSNSSNDLTKVSTMSGDGEHFMTTTSTGGYRVTHPPKVSRSPVSFTKKHIPNLEKESTTSTIITSSTSSTLTNVTIPTKGKLKFSSSNAQRSEFDNQSEFDKTLHDDDLNQKSLVIQDNLKFDDDIGDSDIYESDEILQMLFKKTYYYQLKLREIDELLTAQN